MATCGKCKSTGVDIAHVKACFAQGPIPVVSSQSALLPADGRDLAAVIPDSDYAVYEETHWTFYRVRRGKKNSRWAGFVFVDRLVGAPGDWTTYPVKGLMKTAALMMIAQAGPQEAAAAFSREHGVCACCGSPLSDPFSIANGIGPVCIKRFAA